MATTIKAVKVENGVRMMLNSRDGKFLAQTRVRTERLKRLEIGRLVTVFLTVTVGSIKLFFPNNPAFFGLRAWENA
jgi:hypothetical protein